MTILIFRAGIKKKPERINTLFGNPSIKPMNQPHAGSSVVVVSGQFFYFNPNDLFNYFST